MFGPGPEPHPAGRTAATPTAYRSMGHTGGAARLEHGHPRLDRHGHAVRIAQPHAPSVARPHSPKRARAKYGDQDYGETEQHPVLGGIDPGRAGRIGPVAQLCSAYQPGRVGRGVGTELPTRVGEANQGQGRQQQGEREQPGLHGPVPRAQPQPEMDPDAAVQPHQHEHEALPPRPIRPQHVQDIGVAVVDPEQLVRAARADHMHDQPERDQEPEDGLSDFPWRHPEAAPAPELMHRKRDVGRERRVQQ